MPLAPSTGRSLPTTDPASRLPDSGLHNRSETWTSDCLRRSHGRSATVPSNPIDGTFGEAAVEFLRYAENVLQVDNSTLRDYRSVIERNLTPRFGAMPLAKISADLIETYRDELLSGRQIGNRTIVRHLTVLHGVFKRAKRVWGLKENPA